MTIACPECGALEQIAPLPSHGTARCVLCDAPLESRNGRSITAAFACSLATLLLLPPTNIFPLLRMSIFGIHGSNTIMGGIFGLWSQGWVLLPVISGMCVVVLPFLRFGLLTAVLGALRLGYRPHWLGSAFRWSVWLDPWAMLDIFLLAAAVGYYRLAHVQQATLDVDIGGKCFVAAAFLTMLTRATLDKRTVWRAIAPECDVDEGEATVACTTCDIVQPLSEQGAPCPRCKATLHTRKPEAMVRTTAILIAAFILFFPANIYPMNISHQLGKVQSYTIFTGIKDLFQNGLWPLGILIFCTSILIPFGKIAAVAWCVAGVQFGWRRHLVFRTKLFRAVAELGRWSKTDPYVIVFFVPLMNFGMLASARAGWGATAFVAMTFLSMAASNTFDPRLMWDAAQGEHEEKTAGSRNLAHRLFSSWRTA